MQSWRQGWSYQGRLNGGGIGSRAIGEGRGGAGVKFLYLWPSTVSKKLSDHFIDSAVQLMTSGDIIRHCLGGRFR